MKKRSLLVLTIVFITLMIPGIVKAQQIDNPSWNLSVSLHYGYPFATNDWEYSHPSYSGFGVQTIRETGSFKAKSFFAGGIELAKGYFGINANAGIFPAEIKVDKPGEHYNFNSIFLELEGIFFPLSSQTDKVIPLLKIGGGGVTSSGDLNNTALFMSFSGGVRTFFTEKFGASLMLKGRHITYDEIPLGENLTGDIVFTNFAIEIEVLYML